MLAAFESGNNLAFAAAGLLTLMTLVRIRENEIYRKIDSSSLSMRQVRYWESRYAWVVAVLFFCVSSWFSFMILPDSSAAVDMLSLVLLLGYIVSVTGRNHASRKVVNLQMLATVPPTLLSLAFSNGGEYLLIVPLSAAFFAVLYSMTKHLRSQLLEAAVALSDKEELAEQFDTALNNMSHGLCMMDADRNVVVINKVLRGQFREMGIEVPDEPVDKIADFFLPAVKAGALDVEQANKAAQTMEACLRDKRTREIEISSTLGRIFHITTSPMDMGGLVCLIDDVTEKHKSQAHIDQLAHYDSLTGLMNRYRMHTELDRVLDTIGPHEECAILFLDLDKFKQVNDTLGHPVGDALLCRVADKLKSLLPKNAKLGRLGGDEFIVLMESYEDDEEITVLADDIIEELAKPLELSGQRIEIGVSIGIATAPRDSTTTDELIKCADVALYCSKSAGRGQWRFFESQMQEAAIARRRLELDLRHAVENNGLTVCFQPLVDSSNLNITTCEALVRWNHPERGMISPAEFIPVAEDTGLIDDIGKYVMFNACKSAAAWPGDVKVAVNVSALQFHGDIKQIVLEALDKSGLPPERLEIEITESVFLHSTGMVRDQLSALRELGVRIALDDFGTGYSSLSYLHTFPLDKVKLDRTFVTPLDEDPKTAMLLEGVIRLCNSLDLDMVIEGIETPAQMERCVELGHRGQLQGFLFGAALPFERIMQFISAQQPRHIRGAVSAKSSAHQAS